MLKVVIKKVQKKKKEVKLVKKIQKEKSDRTCILKI